MGISAPRRFVGLLRGINVGGHNTIAMATLRDTCASLRFTDIKTYIASGNVVFSSTDADHDALAARLRGAVAERCFVDVPIVVVPAARFARLGATMPFGDVPDDRHKLVHLGFTQGAVPPSAAAALAARAGGSERVVVVEDALWIDYGDGVQKSKLTPSAIDAAVQAPVTLRNMKTVAAIAALL